MNAGGNGFGRSHLTVVADALIQFEITPTGGRPLRVYRFLELDRASTPVSRLVDKLLAYLRLAIHESTWSHTLPTWPTLMVVFAGKRRAQLEQRKTTLAGALRNDPRARLIEIVATLLTLYDDLMEAGPFAPVFSTLESSEGVNVLGQAEVFDQ